MYRTCVSTSTPAEQDLPARATENELDRIMTILTTEHYNLQSMRSGTISETNGRASIFLGAVSAGLVAIGFAAGTGGGSTTVAVFSLVILVGLTFLGLTTFTRTVQSSIDDVLYSLRIDAIRQSYSELAPGVAPFLAKVTGRDLYIDAAQRSRWQRYVSVSGTIAAITSILIGAGIGIITFAVLGNLWVEISAGSVAAVASDIVLMRIQSRQWQASSALPFRGRTLTSAPDQPNPENA